MAFAPAEAMEAVNKFPSNLSSTWRLLLALKTDLGGVVVKRGRHRGGGDLVVALCASIQPSRRYLLWCCGGDWTHYVGCSRVAGTVSIECGGGDLIWKKEDSTHERRMQVDGFGSPLRRYRMRLTKPRYDERGEDPRSTCHKVSGRVAARFIGSQRSFVCYGVISVLGKLVSLLSPAKLRRRRCTVVTDGCFASRSPKDLCVIFVGSFCKVLIHVSSDCLR